MKNKRQTELTFKCAYKYTTIVYEKHMIFPILLLFCFNAIVNIERCRLFFECFDWMIFHLEYFLHVLFITIFKWHLIYFRIDGKSRMYFVV